MALFSLTTQVEVAKFRVVVSGKTGSVHVCNAANYSAASVYILGRYSKDFLQTA